MSRRPSRLLLTLAAALWLGAAARDRLDAWIDATPLPPLTAATSTEVLDRRRRACCAPTPWPTGAGGWR